MSSQRFCESCSIRKIVKFILLSVFAVSALFGIALAAGVTTVKITEDKTKPDQITTTSPEIDGNLEFACDGSARISIENVLWEHRTYNEEIQKYSDWCIFIPKEPRSRVPYSAQCAIFAALPISLHDDELQKAFESTRAEKNIEIIEFGGETNRRGDFSWFDGSDVDFMEEEINSGSGELYLDSAGWEVKSVARNASAHFACYIDLKSTTTTTQISSSSSSSTSPTLSSTIPTSTIQTNQSTTISTTATTEETTIGWSYCDSNADKADILWTNTPIYDGANNQFKNWCVFIPRESRQIGVSLENHCGLFFAQALSIHDSKLQSAIELGMIYFKKLYSLMIVLREHSEIAMVSVGGQKQSRNEDFSWDDKT
ncbi:unnamed protein product [Oikopleura dioica]|uniref:C-type lectin domain-containing protein n=1 Tax=Oikopleura dioica TaxID=34765 RepID=E4YI11_OIKDI|nr:unnamed protein product [Oikopleura dioica]